MNYHEELVSALLVDPGLHARFVNTLSMLEYLGARKILKSQRADSISLEILRHAAEEIRHAQILKSLALRWSGGELRGYREEELLCGRQAREYFHRLEEECALMHSRTEPTQVYTLTTLLVEKRAVRFYPVYALALKKAGIPNALGAILNDERNHLEEMQREAAALGCGPVELARLRAREESLFRDLLFALRDEIKLPGGWVADRVVYGNAIT